ncbi:chorion peroxidase-like isoform X2 [Aricia agestis]|uniref:chorion peroxidase-like isoform X2 n=1 Tax=Aricia agestis TaxID=91739 RepID=UPI001C2019DD|nr:chorion peroxidase-like isoform X2 [Aricia agestis]
MQRAGPSSERSPLVQPTYTFETSVSKSYQQRLRTFQCIICVVLFVFLSVVVLVTVSYNLMMDFASNSSEVMEARGPLKMALGDDISPILNITWPLKHFRPDPAWVGEWPSKEKLAEAIARGKEKLRRKRLMEDVLAPLDLDTPASRAQSAAYTSSVIKPWADNAYAVEEATRVLINGTPASIIGNGIGIGPKVEGLTDMPFYCTENPPPCPPTKYRSQDGSCNNLQHPLSWGVANTPFRRAETPWYGDGISSPRFPKDTKELPSARDVSVTVHRPSYAHDSGFTVMLAVWGQFIDHDITATALSKGANNTALKCCDQTQPPHPECFPVKLDVEDPFYQNYNLTCMEFVRSAPALNCNYGPREQVNQATAFLDGSTVYGSSEFKTTQLRTTAGQLRMLKVGMRELLPPSTDPNDGCNTVEMNAKGRYCFESGDERASENLHLTTMHLIWARQHNRLARELKQLIPAWTEEVVFEGSRRIVGAQMQDITYSELLHAILGDDIMFALNLTLKEEGYSDSYDPTVDPSIANHFSAAAFRFAHTLLPGLIRNTDASTGSINYVHLHQMLFNPYTLYNKKGPQTAMSSAMNTLVHSVDPHVTAELSEHLFERPTALNGSMVEITQAKPAGPCGLDLVSLNIQRGRDHGLPPYRVWREHCGLSRPWDFGDLETVFDDVSLTRIKQIYSHVDDIDLYTGALAENPRGRLLGPTFTCLIADQFLRLKIGDRFWYETSDPEVRFTEEQLVEIRKTTLASVICANEVLLDQAQPRVMEALSPTNPLVDCMELPQPSLAPWKVPTPEPTQ